MIYNEILRHYDFNEKIISINAFGEGLINHTRLITTSTESYILQKINDNIFKEPIKIAENIEQVKNYLTFNYPEYYFVSPLATIDNHTFLHLENGYYRIFPFVKNSSTKVVLESPEQAYEAAKQFALFTKNLSGFDVSQLHITLPDFHNLDVKYQQFVQAISAASPDRLAKGQELIDMLEEKKHILATYEKVRQTNLIKKRVTHHDTKISNILFDNNDKGICVIDLDTMMPGYFISDVGDMMRTYISPVSEEESDFEKIVIRDEFYEAIFEGYMSTMGSELSSEERKYFFYSGSFMIYMQALRFLTDYLNNDIYYGAKYPDHNFIRAKNQTILLHRFQEKKQILCKLWQEK